MSEQTLSEALANLDNDDYIENAAVPEDKREASDDLSDESTFVELSEEEYEEINPVTEDEIQEEFQGNEVDYEEDEVERRTRTAQERINKAVKQAKDYQRRELQALQYAKQLQEENEKISRQLKQSSQQSAEQNMQMQENYSVEFQNRIEAQAEAAKRQLSRAFESGDQESMVEAQQLLARSEADRSSLNKYKQELEQYKKDYAKWVQDQAEYENYMAQQVTQQPQNEEPVYQEPSEKAQTWASNNEWFGKDQVMTNVAFAVHQELANSGVDLESDEYYSELDKRIRAELPHKFGEENLAGNGKPVQTVVSGSRTTSSGRTQNDRRIELSPSEQQLARKLGVPFKEYAKQKMRLQRS